MTRDCDPRHRPHPDVLRITVETFEEVQETTLDAVGAVREGEEQLAVVSFHTVGKLRKILTDRRSELLGVLMSNSLAEHLAKSMLQRELLHHTIASSERIQVLVRRASPSVVPDRLVANRPLESRQPV